MNLDLDNATVEFHDLKVDMLNGKLENQANLNVHTSQIRHLGMDASEDSKYSITG
ncbi:MAG: hypothetical protein LBR08_02825 [Bacteroidales bacterium]|jgi:hypothetical protein|nr:hypothetical protein [Bacteroidales bacterium]